MSAAAVELQTHDELFPAGAPATLRLQAAEVLASHRSRRRRNAADRTQEDGNEQLALPTALPSRSQSIALRVTERYARSPSYRAFLAAEAEEATRRAKAAAEVAARTADAIAEAQKDLMKELAYADRDPAASGLCQGVPAFVAAEQPFGTTSSATVPRASLTVKLFEDTGSVLREASPSAGRPVNARLHANTNDLFEPSDAEEALALDEEISYRQSPSFDLERVSVPIPGNLLEFPRQLVAARKARPRYAEGPLLEEGEQGRDYAQLRIFEVDATQITSAHPAEASTPEWSSIWLDALTEGATNEIAESTPASAMLRPEAAPLELRAMACVVDACLVGMGFIVFATAFAYHAAILPSLPVALTSSALGLAGIFLMYQLLFFTLSNATPGMRYARIGLCTFGEENPTHLAMLMRIGATLLAACPLGLGFLWACLDDDGLGWHDRLSGMYQRSY